MPPTGPRLAPRGLGRRPWAPRIDARLCLQRESDPFRQPLPKCLLSQPPDLGLVSSFSHLGPPRPARWPLRLSHCAEPGCRTKGVRPFPRTPREPIDGRIAGE